MVTKWAEALVFVTCSVAGKSGREESRLQSTWDNVFMVDYCAAGKLAALGSFAFCVS